MWGPRQGDCGGSGRECGGHACPQPPPPPRRFDPAASDGVEGADVPAAWTRPGPFDFARTWLPLKVTAAATAKSDTAARDIAFMMFPLAIRNQSHWIMTPFGPRCGPRHVGWL